MSAETHPDSCPQCGSGLPVRARFCPDCGLRLGDPGSRTLLAELPPHETGPVPITMQRVEPRWFGVTPPTLLLAVSGLALFLALVLFVGGHWPYGLILLGLAALLLAAYLEAARRRPHRETPIRTGSPVGERTRSAWEEWRARAAAAAEVKRLRSALLLIESDRRRALEQLGVSAHFHDGYGEAAARAELVELDRHEAALQHELESQLRLAGERIRKAKLPVQETMMVLPSEPYPPPGEATPPQPAVVPEPYPPPDEGTPPQPAPVPEPVPDPGPDRTPGADD